MVLLLTTSLVWQNPSVNTQHFEFNAFAIPPSSSSSSSSHQYTIIFLPGIDVSSNAVIHESTNQSSWISTTSQGGTIVSFDIIVTDNDIPPLFDTKNMITSGISTAPVFTQIPDVIVADRGYTQSINIIANSNVPNNNNLNFVISPLADFMNLTQDDGSAVLTVSPSTSAIFDTHTITVTVTDSRQLSVSKDIMVIDPEQKIVASDGASGDHFGNSVAIHGDTILVGAWGDGYSSGSAYIFTKNDTTWIQTQKITASDGASGDKFGLSVAIHDDTILVGAWGDGDKGSSSGSAYIFTKNDTTWIQTQKITASDGASNDYFGRSVAIHDDTILVDVYRDGDKGSSSGSAYIFTKNDTTWIQTQKITASDGASGDWFGGSVAIHGDTILVGAWGDGDKGSSSGSAYIFTKNDTTWIQTQKITASDGASGDSFSRSVAIHGDTILVGALGDDGKGSSSGSAYIFTKNDTTWIQTQKITASDGASNDYFGRSVAIHGDTILVGALGDDDKGYYSGSAYIFTKNDTTWIQTQKITASDGISDDWFGYSVAIHGDTILVGTLGDDDKGYYSGSAYIITPSKLPYAQIP